MVRLSPSLTFIEQGTRPNQLFLTEAIERNVDALKPIINWFRRVLTIIPAEADYQGLEIGILSDEYFTHYSKLDLSLRLRKVT
ncbi:hypothetical protein [Phormidium nigroviride]